jgi:hypothetical protein
MTIDARTYPRARLGRTGPPSSTAAPIPLGGAGPTIPRMRIFSFVFTESASSRRTLSFGALTGPAIIQDLMIWMGTVPGDFTTTVEIGKSLVAVTEAGVALTVARPYDVLTELKDPFNLMADAGGQGINIGAVPGVAARFPYPLMIPVTDASFYAIVALVNNSANAQNFNGSLRVLEGLSYDAFAGFTG